jgi:hypothetical protein
MTNNERKAIQGILNSDFMDGMTGTEAVGHWVWSWSANPFQSKKTFSGVVASLVKKGYVVSEDYDGDNTIKITAQGMAAFQEKE